MTQSGGEKTLSDEQLGQLNRLATSARLVAGLAHELNNSLQVVSGLVELLGDHPDVPPDAAARIRKIGAQADKATTAVRQVLGYTREGGMDAGRLDLAAVVDRAIGLRRYNLGRAGISVSTDIAQGLTVAADERALGQVILNLILNAEDALAGQPRKDLHIAAATGDGRVRVAVRDSGHGVDDALRQRIFEPFFTTRTDSRAVGLGLPVARLLAGGFGGSVELAEGHAGATTFVVECPAAEGVRTR